MEILSARVARDGRGKIARLILMNVKKVSEEGLRALFVSLLWPVMTLKEGSLFLGLRALFVSLL